MKSLALVASGLAVLVGACTTTNPPDTADDADVPLITASVPPTATRAPAAAEPTTSTTDAALLAVYHQTGFYTEGSLTHLEVYQYFPDVDHFPVPISILDQEAPPPGTLLLNNTLPPGIYELRSYQRPCIGSCDVLEPPSDGCATRFSLEAGAKVQAGVTVRPGLACLIDVVGANVESPVRDMDLTLQPHGAVGCQPESPSNGTDVVEVLATSSSDTVAWGLVWPPVDGRVKMVFRLTGEGDFDVVARHEDGTEIRSDWRVGEGTTDSSSYGRPGAEWGMLFDFPADGCWNIHFVRGDDTADVWLVVTDI